MVAFCDSICVVDRGTTDQSLSPVRSIQFQKKIREIRAEYHRIQGTEDKMADITSRSFETNAFQNYVWKGPYRKTRHLVTRFAIHGFHHRVCSLCSEKCPKYHADECRLVFSIKDLINMPDV